MVGSEPVCFFNGLELSPLLLDNFPQLAYLFLQLRDLRFDALMLLVHAALVLELHGERRDVAPVIFLIAGLAAAGELATLLAAPLTAASLSIIPSEALATAQGDRNLDALIVAQNG